MKTTLKWQNLGALILGLLCLFSVPVLAQKTALSGGGIETIKVSKCFYVAGNGTMLVNAGSSNPNARLFVYRSSGEFVCEVQNGGGGKYGGTVFYIGADPVSLIIQSNYVASITVATVPFQP